MSYPPFFVSEPNLTPSRKKFGLWGLGRFVLLKGFAFLGLFSGISGNAGIIGISGKSPIIPIIPSVPIVPFINLALFAPHFSLFTFHLSL